MTLASACIAASSAASRPLQGVKMVGLSAGHFCAGASTHAIAAVLLGLSRKRQLQPAAQPRLSGFVTTSTVVENTPRTITLRKTAGVPSAKSKGKIHDNRNSNCPNYNNC